MTTLRGRSRSALPLGLAALLLVTPVFTGVSQAAGAEPDKPSPGATRIDLKPINKPEWTKAPDTRAADAQSSCDTVKANADTYLKEGKRVVGCAEFNDKIGTSRNSLQSVWCEGLGPGWFITRRESCNTVGILWTLFEIPTYRVLGQAQFTIRQTVETFEDPVTPYWSEDVSMTMDDAWGYATSGDAEFTENCPLPCRMTNTSAWGGRQRISIGATLDGTFENSDFPIPGPDSFVLQYTASFVIPGSFNLPAAIPEPPRLRCDHVVALNAGCVYPDSFPQLYLPVSQYREAALTVAFGNYFQHPGFGYRQPLSRLADQGLIDFNRDTICDGTFYPIFADDSCDEFAFASTYQSGAMNGVPSGIFCAEVYFEEINGQWYWNAVRSINGTEICVRAHVPSGPNSLVGSALIGFINSQRLLNGDPYWAFAV